MFARLIFEIVKFNARNGLNERPAAESVIENAEKHRALRTGVRGETYAYWYLRRHGYTLVARNFTSPGLKGEIDMVGYDGQTLAFVEVKTRSRGTAPSTPEALQASPESAVNIEKRQNISRVARQFLRARHLDENAECRFDVLAIETRAGQEPVVRLHKGAFNAGEYRPRQY